jgi:hypothetical protein
VTVGNIILHQSGAKSHIQGDGKLFQAKGTELVGDPNAVKLFTQPAQSPDLNVNDLCFFHSLHSRYSMTLVFRAIIIRIFILMILFFSQSTEQFCAFFKREAQKYVKKHRF